MKRGGSKILRPLLTMEAMLVLLLPLNGTDELLTLPSSLLTVP